MELRRTETGFALYKEKEAIGHCTLHPAAQGAALAALAIDPAWRRKGYGVYDKGGASIIQDLATERPASGAGYVYKSENQMGSLSFNVEVASKASTGATVFATYYHRKNEKNLAISVSIPIGGSVSISDESSYEQIGNNPTITFALNK